MRILLLILSLLFCVSVDAQKLTVESFAEKTNDLAARTEERVDYNKVPCALVKVWLAAPGAIFEGNVMGDVAYKASEYRVYMSKGSKRVLVKLEGYLPLPVEFPQPLESSVTYLLTVSGITTSAPREDSKQQVATPTVVAGDHEYVDLGLSVKWATCNVGASQPWEYGDYYAWGETTTKSDYSWGTYKYCRGTWNSMTKYCTESSYGTVDNKTQLDPQDDVAHVKWGGSWRMPTKAEQDELSENCKWKWTKQNGVEGYKVTSKKNGNSIFLPAAGCRYTSSLNGAGSDGYYWSSSLYSGYSYYAYVLYFCSSIADPNYRYNRCYGRSVRAVCP